MTDIAETKARLLGKHIKKAIEEHDKKNALDLTPILKYLKASLAHVDGIILRKGKFEGLPNAREMKGWIHTLEWKERLEYLIGSVERQQADEMPINIHILSIYLFPELYDYASQYDPTNDCRVSPLYDAIGKVLCNWSGDAYYGD